MEDGTRFHSRKIPQHDGEFDDNNDDETALSFQHEIPLPFLQSDDSTTQVSGYVPSKPEPSALTPNFNPDHLIVTGVTSFKPDDVEGGIIATKLRGIHALSQPKCLAGKVHLSHNQVGDKTAMGIFEWESEDAFATWQLCKASIELWEQLVDFVQKDSVALHRWKRIPDPRIMQSNLTKETISRLRECPRASKAAQLFDKSLSVDAFVVMLWFRPIKGQEPLLIKKLWEIQLKTEMEPVGSSIRFDIHRGYDPDMEGVIMVYIAFEHKHFFQLHLAKDYNILNDQVCNYLESEPLMTTWKTIDVKI